MINEIPFRSVGIDLMNKLGKARTPFLFLVDYKMDNAIVLPLDEIDNNVLCYDLNGNRNYEQPVSNLNQLFQFTIHPVAKEVYQKGFNEVMRNIQANVSC